MRLCERWRYMGSGCSLPQLIRPYECGTYLLKVGLHTRMSEITNKMSAIVVGHNRCYKIRCCFSFVKA